MLITYPQGQIVGRAFDDTTEIRTVTFSKDTEWLLGGSGAGNLQLWDVGAERSGPKSARGHSRAIVDIAKSGDGALLATLGHEQTVRLWTMQSAHPMARVERVNGNKGKGVAVSPDGRRLAVGDDAGVVQVWDLEIDAQPLLFRGHTHQVWALAFSPDSSKLISADRSGEIRAWNLATGALEQKFQGHDSAIWSLALTPGDGRLVTAGENEVRVWDTADYSLLATLPQNNGSTTRAALSPDGQHLAVASSVGVVEIWDLDTNRVTQRITADDNLVWSVRFSPDSKHLATASSDEVVALWDVATGKQSALFTDQTGGATDVAFLADGVTIVATDRRGGLHFWDSRTGRRLSETLRAHKGASWRLKIHPDGQRFVTTGDDGTVKVWDVFDTQLACKLGKPALDQVRRDQYLGRGEDPAAC